MTDAKLQMGGIEDGEDELPGRSILVVQGHRGFDKLRVICTIHHRLGRVAINHCRGFRGRLCLSTLILGRMSTLTFLSFGGCIGRQSDALKASSQGNCVDMQEGIRGLSCRSSHGKESGFLEPLSDGWQSLFRFFRIAG